jgi:hypothetical protein
MITGITIYMYIVIITEHLHLLEVQPEVLTRLSLHHTTLLIHSCSGFHLNDHHFPQVYHSAVHLVQILSQVNLVI